MKPAAYMTKDGYVYGQHETRPVDADIPLYKHSELNPVAMRYDFDGYGYKYIDSGSGSDWQTREKGELLYTHPPFAFADLGEGESIPLYDHPMRELTDAEIEEIYWSPSSVGDDDFFDFIEFARSILKKAREK